MSLHSLSLDLETTACKIMNFKKRPKGTMFDSDSIERETFVEVMILLLKVKNNFDFNEEIEMFANTYQAYIDKAINVIGIDEANTIYHKFKKLIDAM
ncbi:MAG: hypothetical protein IJD64_04560 [Clostridia bacterium]|nr:hypothetical protein [Clostridia bacterium]